MAGKEDIKAELERTIEDIPAFSVVRSIYHEQMEGKALFSVTPNNPSNTHQQTLFDAILLAHAMCPDQKLLQALPGLDSKLFAPYLTDAMVLADPYETDRDTRKRELKKIEFVPLRALAFGVRSELQNDIRFRNEEQPRSADARNWPAEVQEELAQYTEGSDGAALMINACLRGAKDN